MHYLNEKDEGALLGTFKNGYKVSCLSLPTHFIPISFYFYSSVFHASKVQSTRTLRRYGSDAAEWGSMQRHEHRNNFLSAPILTK
jgi:hypothetical protein